MVPTVGTLRLRYIKHKKSERRWTKGEEKDKPGEDKKEKRRFELWFKRVIVIVT